MTIMAMALAACGGGSGDDDNTGGGGTTPPPSEGVEEAGCFDECKKFMAALVDDFAGGAAPAARSTKAAEDGLDIIVEGDKVTFSVASVDVQSAHPGELNAAFPVSDDSLDYKLTIDKSTGEITVDNNDGKTFTLKAYEEASYFQEIDYGKTDLADKNKAHYAYIRFDPKVQANAIDKDAQLRRQWKQASGEDYPSPGVSIMLHTHYQDCPGGENICDVVMLTANPDMHGEPEDPDVPVPSTPQISATVDGTLQTAGVNVQGTWIVNGSAGNSLSATGSGSPPIVWSIQHLKAAVGTYTCGTSGEMGDIVFNNPAGLANDPMNAWKFMNLTTAHRPEGGKCTVKVTKADETVMEGTFTATIVGLGLAPGQTVTYAVTNGAFSVPKR